MTAESQAVEPVQAQSATPAVEYKSTATFRAIPLKDLGRKSFIIAIPTDDAVALKLDQTKDPIIKVTIEVEKV